MSAASRFAGPQGVLVPNLGSIVVEHAHTHTRCSLRGNGSARRFSLQMLWFSLMTHGERLRGPTQAPKPKRLRPGIDRLFCALSARAHTLKTMTPIYKSPKTVQNLGPTSDTPPYATRPLSVTLQAPPYRPPFLEGTRMCRSARATCT